MEFRILGPLEVVGAGTPVPIPPGKQRALLAVLLLNANAVVSVERLVDALWGSSPPDTSANALQVYVSQLRRQLEPDRPRGAEPQVLRTVAPGYTLRIEEEALDLFHFERLAEQGRRALAEGDFAGASERLRDALRLWRGPALADVPLESDYASDPARLDDMRLAAVEDRLEAELALGRTAEHVPTLEALIAENPLRERFRGQLMLALYRSGRQAEALAAYQAARETLVDELGIEPSPALQRLERAILVQDPALEEVAAPPRPAAVVAEPAAAERAPEPPAARESRRHVTVTSWTLAATTSAGEPLDPEVWESLAARTFAILERAHERHGASVDAQLSRAVFGIPHVHEDDALRAVRAATEASRELELFTRTIERERGLRVAARIGIETGLVLVAGGDATAPQLVGSPLAAAAGLAHEAGPGEILIGPGAERLVHHAVRASATEQGAWQVLEVLDNAVPIPRTTTTPLVGRGPELSELRAALDRATENETCVLATVFGAPGIGKTRLAQELRAALPEGALFVQGRCLPYGEGITYSALREIVVQAVGEDLGAGLERATAELDDGQTICERLRAALETGQGTAAPEEVAWAARRLFETLASSRPLVVCFDDVHWAEQALIALIEHVAQFTAGAPILLLCLARPESAERPFLSQGGTLNTLSLALEPLGPSDSAALIDELAPANEVASAIRLRVAEAAEGNPLFIEQMLAALREEGTGHGFRLPPTIEALLAARLDLLDQPARDALERAAVVGRMFSRRAVVELLEQEAVEAVDSSLATLIRRQLIASAGRPRGELQFRFAHELIRDVCYAGIPKAVRADLHERFADWAEREGGEALDLEEVVGHHLAQAHRWLAEAEPESERLPELAARAAALLASAGRRAYAAGNLPTAIGHLTRAVALLADDPRRPELLVALGGALREVSDFERSREVVAEALGLARASGDRRIERRAELLGLRIELSTQPEIAAPQLLARADQAIADLDRLGDDQGLAEAWTAVAWIRWIRCRAEETEQALQRALLHGRRAGDERSIALNLNLFLGAGLFGPTPVSEAIERCEQLLGDSPGPRLEAAAYRALGGLHAMLGRFDEAREFLERDSRIIEELGLVLAASGAAETWGIVELLAGRPDQAERRLREGYALLAPTGEKSELSTLAAVLAEAVYVQGRLDEALGLTAHSEKAAAPDDLTTQVQWRGVRAKVLAARDEVVQAEPLAREAVSMAAESDFLNLRGQAALNLAEVWFRAGREEEGAVAVAEARELFERKGNRVAAERAGATLAAHPTVRAT